ncbi:hypothetical protein EDB86DRAFT_543283 [Lactarius hatsudake]|nr:hypothetical protein EDB86DRAFT_543283 [Lactarius hatsudake]
MSKLVDVFKSSVRARSLDRYKGYCSCTGGCNGLRFVNLITTMTSLNNKDGCGMEAWCENNYGTLRSTHFVPRFNVPLPTPFHQLSSLLEAQHNSFISGNKEIQDAALRATEHVSNIALRLREAGSALAPSLTGFIQPYSGTCDAFAVGGKRKRGPSPLSLRQRQLTTWVRHPVMRVDLTYHLRKAVTTQKCLRK